MDVVYSIVEGKNLLEKIFIF